MPDAARQLVWLRRVWGRRRQGLEDTLYPQGTKQVLSPTVAASAQTAPVSNTVSAAVTAAGCSWPAPWP